MPDPVQVVYSAPRNNLGDSVAELFATLRGERTKKAAEQEQMGKFYAQQFLALPQDVQDANFDKLDPSAKQYVLDRRGYTPHQQTAEEQLAGLRTQTGIEALRHPEKLGIGGSETANYQFGTGKEAPKELISSNIRNATYNQDPSLNVNPATLRAQGTEDKLIESDGDRQKRLQQGDQFTTKLNAIDIPKNRAVIGHLGAQSVEQYAAAGNQNSQARYHDAQAQGEASGGVGGMGGGVSGVSVSPAVVKMIIDRDYDPKMMRRWKPEQVSAIMEAVRQSDPGFNMNDYETQAAAKKNFAGGGEAMKTVRSINQLIGHASALDQNGDKLGNSDFRAVNAASNWLGDAAGNRNLQASLGAYDKSAAAVANEFETMMRGSSNSTAAERKEILQSLDHNVPPAKRKAAIKEMLSLMNSRLVELDNQYSQGVGRQRDFAILNPGANTVLKSYGIDTSALTTPTDGRPRSNVQQHGAPAMTPDAASFLKKHGY